MLVNFGDFLGRTRLSTRQAAAWFVLLRVSRKVFLHLAQSKSPISSWVFFPVLSALPTITHFFLGEAASVPHFSRFPFNFPQYILMNYGF